MLFIYFWKIDYFCWGSVGRNETFIIKYIGLYISIILQTAFSKVKSSQVCFIVNSVTCTAHKYRELKLRNSQTLGAYS